MGLLRVSVREAVSDKPLTFRAYLTDADGTFHRPTTPHLYFGKAEEHHFLSESSFEAELLPGTYHLRIERGPEYFPFEETLRIGERETIAREVILKRWVWMNSCGWFSGDLHVHRKPEEMPLAVLAEDLNVGTNITYHNAYSPPVPPNPGRAQLDDTTVYSTLDAEIERLFDGMGSLVFLGLHEPIPMNDFDDFYPSDAQFCHLAKAQGAHVDAEKPFWKGVPVNAALGELDSMGVVPNHFHRNKVMRESARWGAVPQDAQFVGDEGFALWILDLYYRFLNCGFRLPATGGTASGIMPSPLGYCRTYVKMPENEFSYDNWFSYLRNGRSFATNGPMLFLNVQDEDPGGILRYPLSQPVTVEARIIGMSQDSLATLELIRDGKVIERMETHSEETQSLLEIQTPVTFARSGWLSARCFERTENNVRYAQTSPIYVFLGTDPIAVADDARFFMERIAGMIRQAQNWQKFRDEAHRSEVVELFSIARDFYARVVEAGASRT